MKYLVFYSLGQITNVHTELNRKDAVSLVLEMVSDGDKVVYDDSLLPTVVNKSKSIWIETDFRN
jgi:hypothetical protein